MDVFDTPGQSQPDPRGQWGPWFTAAFFSDCKGCWDGIYEGDQARYDPNGVVVCEECGQDD